MRTMRYAIVAVILLGPLFGGCGSGLDDPFGINSLLVNTFPTPVRTLEGSLANDGTVDPDAPLRVGDDEDDKSWRAFTSFSLSVPAGRTLHRADLRLHQGSLVGDPYGKLGLLFVERIEMGPTRDVADWSAPAGARSIGHSDPATGPLSIDVTAHVAEALAAGLTRVDFRIRFSVSVIPDGVAEHTHFTSFWHEAEPASLPPTLQLDWRATPGD